MKKNVKRMIKQALDAHALAQVEETTKIMTRLIHPDCPKDIYGSAGGMIAWHRNQINALCKQLTDAGIVPVLHK